MSLRPLQRLDAVRDLRGLTPVEKLVLFVLATRADAQGRCFPSYAGLSRDSGLARRTVMRAIAGLILKKAITLRGRRDDHGQTSNVYVITVEVVSHDHHPVTEDHYPVPHDHQGGDSRSPGVVTDDHRGGVTESPEGSQGRIPIEGTHGRAPRKRGKPGQLFDLAEGTAKESTDHAKVIAAFVEAHTAAKKIAPTMGKGAGARNGKAAKQLLEVFSVEDVIALIQTAYRDPFFVANQAALFHIANSPDKFRGARPGTTKGVVQPVADRAWAVGSEVPR